MSAQLQREYISTTDTAKMIRKQLKAAFPAVIFSVKSKKYAGGSSIRIEWTDGPLVSKVDPVVKCFAGAEFDGMVDLKSYKDSIWQGKRVHFGADYVFTDRNCSMALYRAAVIELAFKYNLDITRLPRVNPGAKYLAPYVEDCNQPCVCGGHLHRSFTDCAHDLARKMEN